MLDTTQKAPVLNLQEALFREHQGTRPFWTSLKVYAKAVLPAIFWSDWKHGEDFHGAQSPWFLVYLEWMNLPKNKENNDYIKHTYDLLIEMELKFSQKKSK